MKFLLVLGAALAACLVMAASLYGVWLYTDEGKNAVAMRLLTVGMLMFNQVVVMGLVSFLIWQFRLLQRTITS